MHPYQISADNTKAGKLASVDRVPPSPPPPPLLSKGPRPRIFFKKSPPPPQRQRPPSPLPLQAGRLSGSRNNP
ncbi:hypothetical protein I3760_15G119300 [Carya illinoinensis]|nr:hypothetical protein I3760_15G119300 [Carya illinoinensis]